MAEPTVTRRARLLSYAGIGLGLFAVWYFVLGGNGGTSAPEPRTAQSYAEEYGGDVGRYDAILRWTDCEALANAFQAGKVNAESNAVGQRDVWRGQMAVTDDRMDALGC